MRQQRKTLNHPTQRHHSTDVAITPKALAFEFRIDERVVRVLLRRRFERAQHYWVFDPAQANRVRQYLRAALGAINE